MHGDGLYGVRQDMSEAEEEQLRSVLNQPAHALPSVHSEMTDEEISEFLEAYRAIPVDQRPVWEPQIYTQADRLQNRDERVAVWLRHGEFLRDQIGKGRVRIFDSDRIPMDALRAATPTFLVRDDVRAHLARIDLRLEEVMEDPSDDEPKNEESPASGPADDAPKNELSPNITRRRWTFEMKERFALEMLLNEEKTALHYGMTIAYARKHLRRIQEEKEVAAKEATNSRLETHWNKPAKTRD